MKLKYFVIASVILILILFFRNRSKKTIEQIEKPKFKSNPAPATNMVIVPRAAKVENETVLIQVSGVGNNDVINHKYESLLKIITFYDDDNEGRRNDEFFNSNISKSQFTLKNDFTDQKFNGQLLCIKY